MLTPRTYRLTFTRWSATDWDRGLNWPDPPPLFDPRSNVGRETSPYPVEWTRETFSTPDKPDVDNNMADRRDLRDAAPSASLSEVRATLLRVADRLSSMEETPSPSKYRAIFVEYEEVMCSIKLACTHK